VQYDGGRLDGFRRGGNDDFALGYYTRDQVPVNAALVDGFTICDHWFAGILGPTYPNRFYTHAAATDRISNTMDVSSLPTIWDRLASAGVPASYYFSDVPFLALWGSKYLSIARPVETFFAQAARGTLPAYSYVDPSFIGEDQGGSNDDHPHADIRRGQALIARVVRAVTQSPAWSKTVLVISYDEWGGFFDHVRPPQLPDAFTPTPTEEHNTAGFRVPAYVVSPFARRNHVTHGQYDHSAILKLVEWRWGLAPLTPRDKAARNLASILDFRGPNLRPPAIPDAADPGPHLCTAGPPGTAEPTGMGVAADDSVWHELAGAATHTGWSSVG
jgi:phospholipase C